MENAIRDSGVDNITFTVDGEEVMRFEPNGIVYVYGAQVDDNQRVYQALVGFLKDSGFLTVDTIWDNAEAVSLDEI